MAWANSSEILKRAKHLDLRYQFVKHIVESGHAVINHVNSETDSLHPSVNWNLTHLEIIGAYAS